MKSDRELIKMLTHMDGKGYGMYKELKGEYQFKKFLLKIDKIQADPYAPPSKMRIMIDRRTTEIPKDIINNRIKKIAVSDFLTRTFYENLNSLKNGRKVINIDKCGQEMLERTSVIIREEELEIRFEAELPSAGRRISGREAKKIFEEYLPEVVDRSLVYKNLNKKKLHRQVELIQEQEEIRKKLQQLNMTAFIADGSILPRKSGISCKPLIEAVTFKSPEKYRISLKLFNGKEITGMGIPKGITLIVGGAYHGKSTLLNALESGVYNHIENDGREYVITDKSAVKVRAEDGRNIEKVNISPFINNLPGGKDTERFSTENASGSTSQAANVIESLESKSALLLIDEDTSAANFMIRDKKMRFLIPEDKEPVTPFTHKIKSLYSDKGVSTILIVGGSGEYFHIAHNVVMMDGYIPKDVTEKAKKIAEIENKRNYVFEGENGEIDMETEKEKAEKYEEFGEITERKVMKKSFHLEGKEGKIKARGKNVIQYGKENIDISYLEQITDSYQTNGIAVLMEFFKKNILDEKYSINTLVDKLYSIIEEKGVDFVGPYTGHPGNYSLPRKYEFIGAVNRYRGLKVKI